MCKVYSFSHRFDKKPLLIPSLRSSVGLDENYLDIIVGSVWVRLNPTSGESGWVVTDVHFVFYSGTTTKTLTHVFFGRSVKVERR